MEENTYSKEMTSKFLNAYKELEDLRNQNEDRYQHFYMIYRSSLDAFRSLRNCLSHYVADGEYPAIVSVSTLEEINHILSLMKVKAGEVAVPVSKITSASITDSLSYLIDKMHNSQFSLLPVFDSHRRLIGVVSDRAMIDLISIHKEALEHKTLNDYLSSFSVKGNSNEYYSYISRDSFAYQAKEIFSLRDGKRRCKAIFVTEHGKKEESVIGLITALDVIDL